MRLLASSPIARTASRERGDTSPQRRQRVHQTGQLLELRRRETRCGSACRRARRRVTSPRPQFDCAARAASLRAAAPRRRRPAPASATGLDRADRCTLRHCADPTTTRRACASGSDRVADSCTLRARCRSRACHGFRVGDRRAAEFHEAGTRLIHSNPSRCISSALRIAAPAAPRMVLWPSATNL